MRIAIAVLAASACGLLGAAARGAECAYEALGEGGELALGRPSGGSVIREFGDQWDDLLQKKSFHPAVDLESPPGEPVHAARSGKVVEAGVKGELGNYIAIDHGGGIATGYGQLSEIGVRPGDCVAGGEEIGKSGATGAVTGPHLHFELMIEGKPVNPLDYLE